MGTTGDVVAARVLPGIWGGLRPLSLADAADIYALTHGAERDATWREMKVGPFDDLAAFEAHIAELLADGSRAFFTVVDPGGRALGWLCLMEVSRPHRSVELGYVLYGTPLQRTTLATEAFYLVMAYIFEELRFHRLEWTCTETNVRSRRAADRLGFVFEGIMRDKLVLKGKTQNIALYSLLATEWPQRKQAMAAWLDPANFDNGQQRSPLR